MAYQVIARKFRPQTYEDVIGQQHVTQTLQNAIRSGRIAHAYIFSGARGVGKTTTARILAKALNCAAGPTPTPDNTCDSCREITAGNSLDVIEIDAASNRGIDQIRELRDMVRYAPASGRYKVIILDEAHMLTDEASNALLKTLEEPPDRVIFVMATTEPEALADTIRSRSQHFHFRALQFHEITSALADVAKREGLRVEPEALAVMARAAEGSVRDALSLLEQARAYCGNEISDSQVRDLLGVVPEEVLEQLVAAIREGSAEAVLGLVHQFQAEGRNLQHFCREAIRHFRNLLIARVCGADSDLIAATPDQRPRLQRDAQAFSEEDLTRYFQILLSTDDDLRRKPDPRLHLEMGLLRMVNASRLAPLEELMADMRGETGTASPSSARRAASAEAAQSAQTVAAASGDQPATISDSRIAAGVGAVVTPAKTNFGSRVAVAPQTTPAPAAPPSIVARAAGITSGIDAAKVEAIKAAVLNQQKFLAEIIEHVSKWELEGSEMRLYFPAESRALADMLGGRGPSEKLRAITSEVIGLPVRVCVKMDAAASRVAARAAGSSSDLRAHFEQDPVVRAMLERFGGQISEVKRRSGG